ncbi:hypothetical protein [Streptomyces sp. MK37H]|uniref:hypothetical protein n=1 Tax=Streptomyces sp. MK37H TaxID=2699117 RepID=UPI001B394D8F|nr:hypothetical protein [Streptomyces sp. MK37H]MBP8533698.1 hypothetical protein [Streptomyces sp. MK37H]
MFKMRIREDGFAAHAYAHDKANLRNVAAVFPGLPYVPGLQECGEFLYSLGYDVVQPQYSGTYDSDGEFSPQSAVDSVSRLQKVLSRGTLTDHRSGCTVTVQSGIEVAAAHSFGTWAVANAFVAGFRPKVLLLLSPFLGVGKNLSEAGARIDLSGQPDHIEKALPFTFRVSSQDEWRSFFTDGMFPFGAVAEGPQSQIIGVTGGQDPGLDPERTRRRFLWFSKKYQVAVSSAEFHIVPTAGHDENGLLVEPVLDALRRRMA